MWAIVGSNPPIQIPWIHSLLVLWLLRSRFIRSMMSGGLSWKGCQYQWLLQGNWHDFEFQRCCPIQGPRLCVCSSWESCKPYCLLSCVSCWVACPFSVPCFSACGLLDFSFYFIVVVSAVSWIGFTLSVFVEERQEDEVLAFPRSVAQELLLCASLAFVAGSDVSVPYLDHIFATDASLQKGAITSRRVSPSAARIAWLGGDKKGCYTKLGNPFAAALRSRGLEDDPSEPLALPQPTSGLDFSFDFVEILWWVRCRVWTCGQTWPDSFVRQSSFRTAHILT